MYFRKSSFCTTLARRPRTIGASTVTAVVAPSGRFTWWDYRVGAFRRNLGLRIDHILLSEPLAARCAAWHVDTAPRRLERPSDHAPVIAELGAS